jgi:hypothetical protein
MSLSTPLPNATSSPALKPGETTLRLTYVAHGIILWWHKTHNGSGDTVNWAPCDIHWKLLSVAITGKNQVSFVERCPSLWGPFAQNISLIVLSAATYSVYGQKEHACDLVSFLPTSSIIYCRLVDKHAPATPPFCMSHSGGSPPVSCAIYKQEKQELFTFHP